MGCSICLDSYDDEADKGRKPVAFPCGHIFHKACSDGWLKACRMRNDAPSCPICKDLVGTGKILSLFPSDINDIEAYLATKAKYSTRQRGANERRAAPGTLALDRHMTKEAQAELLERLMDFRLHICSYVMGVNDVRMDYKTTTEQQQIYRLFSDLGKGNEAKEQEFKSAIEALEEAASTLNESMNATEGMRRDIESKQQRVEVQHHRMQEERRSIDRHLATKAEEEQRMHIDRARLQRMEMHCKMELASLERRKNVMEAERAAYINEAKEKDLQANKARLETAQAIAKSKGESDDAITSMRQYCLEQERLRMKAEEEARAANEKSSRLADRNKSLSNRLSKTRTELEKVTKGSRSIGSRKSASIKNEEEEDDKRISGKGKARQDLLSSDSRAQLEDDGFVEVGYRAGSVRPASASFQSGFGGGLYSGSSIKRSRMSNEHDDEPILVVDNDGDGVSFEDLDYYMPGFGVQQYPVASSSSMMPGALMTEHFVREEVEGDDSVEIVGDNFVPSGISSRVAPSNYSNTDLIDTINNSRNLQLGPRLRSRR